MERFIMEKLIKWKNSKNRKPLILKGARQVGKTYILQKFGQENYENVAYFNFDHDRNLYDLFEDTKDPKRILEQLAFSFGKAIIPGKTLIFFDEIQACERALTSLKYFAESNTKYHVVAAGSLLGIAINRQKYSFPVGKVKMLTLYPLDFEEFLWALDKKDLANMIRQAFSEDKEFSLHSLANEYYRLYLVIGGMPRAIL